MPGIHCHSFTDHCARNLITAGTIVVCTYAGAKIVKFCERGLKLFWKSRSDPRRETLEEEFIDECSTGCTIATGAVAVAVTALPVICFLDRRTNSDDFKFTLKFAYFGLTLMYGTRKATNYLLYEKNKREGETIPMVVGTTLLQPFIFPVTACFLAVSRDIKMLADAGHGRF